MSQERAAERLAHLGQLPPAERRRYLETACDDPRLRSSFEALLAEAGSRPPAWPPEDQATGPLMARLVERLSADHVTVGDTISSVVLVEVLGEGGMGTVYRGFDRKLERPVAVKTIRLRSRVDPAAKARFRREARILSRLNHPAICQVYDLVERPEADYLLLEFVEGKTLRQWLGSQPGAEDRLAVARALAEALTAAHERGVVHRDLKPDNVMVSAGASVKVLDFGIARSLLPDTPELPAADTDRSGPEAPEAELAGTAAPPAGEFDPAKATFRTRLGSIMGTVAYMSPEQARGEDVTEASDLHSLGLLLQEIFTGLAAYPSLPLDELLGRVQRGETLPAMGLPDPLTRLVEQLKARAPELRPSAAETRRLLDEFAGQPARRARRRLALLGAVAAVLLAAAAALIGWRLGHPSPLLAEGERARVALLPIENASGDRGLEWVSKGLTELVTRQLDHLDNVDIIPPERVAAALEAAAPTGRWTTADLPAVSRRVGADLVIEARTLRQDADLVLEYRAVRSGGRPGPWRSVTAAEPSEAANRLARQLATRLAPGAPPVDLRDRFSAHPDLNRLYAMGIDRLRSGGGRIAASYFRVCVDRDADFAWARAELAAALLEGGDFDGAERESRRAEEQAERSGDRALLATARLRRSLVLERRGAREEAERLARGAVDGLRGGGDRTRLAEALHQLGQIAWERGDLDTAERLQEEALKLSREAGDKLAAARVLRALGVIADTRWQLDRSVDLFRRALESVAGEEVPVLRATILNSMGISLHYAGHLEEAERAIREALDLNRRVANPSGEVANLSNLGDLALRRRDWKGAVEVLRSALALAERLGYPRGRGTAAINLAHALIRLGQLDEAQGALTVAATVLGEEDWNVVANRGLLAYERGDVATALTKLERSKRLADQDWGEYEESLLATVASASRTHQRRPLP